MNVLLLIAGLSLILAGAHLLTDGAAAVAERLRIPEFVIGLTVVAVGTSAPELVVSLLSAAGGQSGVAIGNVVGSNLFNTLVILGLCALVRPLPLTEANVRRDIPFGLGAALLLIAVLSDRWLGTGPADRIGRGEGIAMLALYIGLMLFTIRQERRAAAAAQLPGTISGTAPDPAACPAADPTANPALSPIPGPARPARGLAAAAAMIVAGLAGLVFGGDLFLDAATAIARALGVAETAIAITLVAGGTSLPELAASLVSVAKGRSALALGNVVGSNIANILLVLGASATVRPLVPDGITPADTAMVALSAAALLAAAFTFRRRVLDRWEGALFLAAYVVYIWYLFR